MSKRKTKKQDEEKEGTLTGKDYRKSLVLNDVLGSALVFQNMVKKLTTPGSEISRAAATLKQMTDGMENTYKNMGQVMNLGVISMVNSPIYEYLKTHPRILANVKEDIEILEPQILEDESLEISQDEREQFRNVIKELKEKISFIDQRIETLEHKEKSDTKLIHYPRPTMATGDMNRNNDFYLTEEYFELMRLWNTLSYEEYSDLPMEVRRGNKKAIRLWELFTIANNIHISDFSKNKVDKKSKRGRKTPTDAEKHKALKDWDGIDKSFTDVTLEEFLARRFDFFVAVSTFHGWRTQLRDKGYDDV